MVIFSVVHVLMKCFGSMSNSSYFVDEYRYTCQKGAGRRAEEHDVRLYNFVILTALMFETLFILQ